MTRPRPKPSSGLKNRPSGDENKAGTLDALVDEAVEKVEAMGAGMPLAQRADFLEDVAAMLEASVDKLRGDDWEKD